MRPFGSIKQLVLNASLILCSFLTFGQDLYWIGSSGSFNDPNHWSLTKNGVSAGIIPNKNTTIHFEKEEAGTIVVSFVGASNFKKLQVLNSLTQYHFIFSNFSETSIWGDFDLAPNSKISGSGKFIFNNEGSLSKINFLNQNYDGDILFKGGNWQIKSINTSDDNSVVLEEGKFNLNNARINTGNFVSKTGNVQINNINSILDVKKSFEIGNSTQFNSNGLYVKTPLDLEHYKISNGVNFGSNYKTLNSTFAVCGATLSSVGISCSGVCDGTLVLNIDPTCPGAPYTLNWSNPSCALPTLNNVGPGTHTITGLCACADFYSVLVFDNIGNLLTISNQVNIPGQSAINFVPIAFVQPLCFGNCNGSITANLSGSVGPYTVTINGSSVVPVPSGNTTYSMLCGGTNSFSVIDTKGCVRNFTINLNQPPTLTLTSVTSSINCNSVCNGSVVINPVGGTPNYTVVSSIPTTSTVSTGGSVALTGLCQGVVTTTITDFRGCIRTSTFTINQPPTLTVTSTQTNVACFGSCTGIGSVTPSGGTAPYTFTWTPGGNNSPINSTLCAGVNTVTIRDNNNCTLVQTLTITQSPSISISATQTNVLCNAQCNGAASVTASGGAGAFTFTWVAPGNTTISTTQSATGLCAGVYTVFVRDLNNCLTQSLVTINQPPALTITAQTQSIQCFGVCSGAATVVASGGNGAPYNATWTPTGSGTISNALCAGNYTVAVTDASACPISTVFTIVQPASITINVSTTSLSCNGVCNGSISFTTSGGLAPIATPTLLTPTGSIVANPPYNALCAGNYTIIVRDASNCVQTRTVTLAQPNLLTSNVVTNSVTCFNACNGSLSGSAVGGTPSYTLSWLTATSVIPGGLVAGACAGTYTFQITDANGCTSNSVVTINQPPAITTTINATSPLCFAGCNGVLNANVSGGVPGYTLNWSNGFTGNPNTNLCAGGYTLTVNDANGCTSSFTAAVLAPSPMTINVSTSSVTCAGNCNGSATVTVTGGAPGYTMNFNTIPVVTNTTGIVGGLCAGPFIVSVNDINGCVQNQNFIITQPIALSAAITGTQNSCNACTGAGTVTASNGTPPYTYSWTNSLSVVVSTSSVASNLCPGNYTATVTDSQGCNTAVNYSVSQVVTVIVVASGTAIPCFGICSATAQANALGGTLPYTYTWNVTAPTQTTQTATNLCAGNYTVTVADALGCANTATVSFANPPAIVIAPTLTNVTCFGQCNGILNSNATGGTGALTYTWLPGGQNTSSITGQCAGNYTVIVRDANGCTQTATMSITQPPTLNGTLNATNPNACIVNNGSICVTPSGGSGPVYSFTWSPAGGSGINSNCYTNLGAGLYSVVVSDNVGCIRTFTANLSSPTGPTLAISTNSINCFGGSNGSATVTASGTPAFTFTWTPAVAFVNIGNTSTATGMLSGTYNIGVTDGNGCIRNQTISIVQSPSLIVNSSVSNALCNASCNGSITLSTSGGTPTYTFSWLPSLPPITGQGTQTVTNLCAGNYTVNITDAASCIVTRTFAITQPAAINVTATPSNLLCNAVCNGSITTLASGGTAPLTYSWAPTGSFLGAVTPTIINLCANVYTLTITDANLCTRIVTTQVNQPTALTSTVNFLGATCSNSCNGTATVTVSGGTPTYSYTWSSSPSTSSIVSTLCAGNVVSTVTDGNGCTVNNSFTITAPPIFSLNLSPFNPLCNAACNGSISTSTVGAQGAVSYVWNPAGSGQNPTGLCAGNYTVVATDGAGCVANSAAILNNPPAILANVTFTNPACNSNCNGIAVSTPTNAVGVVNYTWLPSGTSTTLNTLNAQCAGNYTVQIQDANGCVDVQTYTLINPPVLNINSSVGPSACSPPSGSITVLATGGTPSYTYTWLPPVVSTSSVLTGLTAGVYTVVVNDANNCTNTVAIPVSSSNGPSAAAITVTNIACNGLCTGAASVTTITGGTPGYTISWVSPPAPGPSNPISGLCAGNYTAQITDANNCILFAGATITQPSSITISPSFTLPTCTGLCNGAIVLNPSGGTGGFNYTWTPSAPNSATLTSLCTGNYSVQIADANNCTSTQSISFPALTNIAALTTSTNNLCFGNCNGNANVAGFSGGLPPYTINWNTGQTTGFISSLCNGSYTATVNDNQGCTNTFTALISSPSAITATTSASQPSCGLCNGSSTVIAAGGVGPYTLSWTNGSSGTTASSLCAGIYQVNIVDFNGCSSLQNVLINSSNGITGQTFNNQNVLCAGNCNGSTTVSPIGGTAPITYSWVAPASTNSFVSGLCPGNYFVQMTDAQGCIRTASTAINAATNLTLTPSVTNPSCAATNGSINVNVTGGTAPYTYTWSPGGANTSSLTNLGVGSYTLLTQDNNGCASSQQFNLTNPTGPVLSFTQSNINCFNACTGSIVVVGTSTSLPITYNWSNGSTSQTVTGLCNGIITVTVSAGGCLTIRSFTITQNPELNLSLSNINEPRCNNDCNGSVTLIPFGGTLPYTFSWNTVPTSSLNPQTALCSGTYIATVTDNRGCVRTQTVNLQNPASLTVTNTFSNSTCSNSNDGSATVTVSGGTPTYNILWNGPATFTSNSATITNIPIGTYTATVVDSRSCASTSTLQIIPTTTLVAITNTPSACIGNSVVLSGTNSIGANTYNWFLLPDLINPVSTNSLFTIPFVTNTSSYVLQVVSTVTTCIDTRTVVVSALPFPIVNAGPSFTIPLFSTVTIGGNPTSPTALSYTWMPPFTLDNSNTPNPTASNTVNTIYTVTVQDANGCIATSTVGVDIYPEIDIPNGFSPNNDGKNDVWIIDNIEQFVDCTVEVYNRWGEQLFFNRGYTKKFDGKYNGKDLPVGTYYYVVNLNHPVYTKPYTGPLTIFR
jgi:gliding motility-associated-like protein